LNYYGYSNNYRYNYYSRGGGLCRADDLAQSEIRLEKFFLRGGLRLRRKKSYELRSMDNEKRFCDLDF
jgi:hypothetical protein